MTRWVLVLAVLLLVAGVGPYRAYAQTDTPTPSPTPTSTPTETPTPTPTGIATAAPTQVATAPSSKMFATLDSGRTVVVDYRITAGDTAIITINLVQTGLLIFLCFLGLVAMRRSR